MTLGPAPRRCTNLALLLAAVFAAALLLMPAPKLPAGWLPVSVADAEPPDAPRPDIGVYEGLGTWIDIHDLPHLKSAHTFKKIRQSGTETIYVETANADSSRFVRPKQIGRLLERAHDSDMAVVAWTLPGHTDPRDDARKAFAAIRFESKRGDRFDGYALDIESTSVRDLGKRNRRMLALSRRIRRGATDVPLGAITYPPLTAHLPWDHFPWKKVSRIYDVMLPMAYGTYRHSEEWAIREYTIKNIELLRRKLGEDVPIHMIGGLASGMTPEATRGFVGAIQYTGIEGGSLYDFRITGSGDWRQLRELL